MGLVLDSSVLIAAERQARPVSSLLRHIKASTGETALRISAVSVIELEHGCWRANTAVRAAKRRLYLEEIYAAIAVQPFTKEMGATAARVDAEARRTGMVIPFPDLQIGVIALEIGYSLVTHNDRHFRMIPNLRICDV